MAQVTDRYVYMCNIKLPLVKMYVPYLLDKNYHSGS